MLQVCPQTFRTKPIPEQMLRWWNNYASTIDAQYPTEHDTLQGDQ